MWNHALVLVLVYFIYTLSLAWWFSKAFLDWI